MKYIAQDPIMGMPVVELTRRNLNALLEMLDETPGQATVTKPSARITVRAVEDDAHYAERRPGLLELPKREVV